MKALGFGGEVFCALFMSIFHRDSSEREHSASICNFGCVDL